jgi:hypothetical protein
MGVRISDSADFSGVSPRKLLADSGVADKPRSKAANNLQQSLYLYFL